MRKNKVREVIERVNVKRVKVCMHFCAHGGNVGRLNRRNIVYRASCFAENNIGLHADKELQKIGNTDIREGIDIKTEIDKASTQRWEYRQIDKLLDRYAFTIRCIFEKSKETEEIVANRHRADEPEKLTVREEKNDYTRNKKGSKYLARRYYFGKNVHAELCHRILRNNDFHVSIPRKKSSIDETYRARRLRFAKEFISKAHIIEAVIEAKGGATKH